MLHRAAPLAAALLLATACAATAPARIERSLDSAVTVERFAFAPARIEIARGTTLTWRNHDSVLHTATAGIAKKKDDLGAYERLPSGAFDGRMDDAGTSFSFTFSTPGEHAYYCDRHPHMIGMVVVR